jgi:hypothetical protein
MQINGKDLFIFKTFDISMFFFIQFTSWYNFYPIIQIIDENIMKF